MNVPQYPHHETPTRVELVGYVARTCDVPNDRARQVVDELLDTVEPAYRRQALAQVAGRLGDLHASLAAVTASLRVTESRLDALAELVSRQDDRP